MCKSQSSGFKASTVYVSAFGRNGSSEIRALPDSGAEVTAADVKILPLLEVVDNLLEPTHLETSSVDGSSLQAIGQLPLTITLGETEVEDMIQIFPSIHGGLLLLWSASKNLCILPPDYPKQLCKIKAEDQLDHVTKDDIRKFPTVFDGQVRAMQGEKFCVRLCILH